jgi:hypothetical protein
MRRRASTTVAMSNTRSLSAGYQEDIFTVRADGTDLRRVTNTPDTEEFGDWGPSRG